MSGRSRRAVQLGPAHWPGSVLVLALGVWVLWSALTPFWSDPEPPTSQRLTTRIKGTWRAREPISPPSRSQNSANRQQHRGMLPPNTTKNLGKSSDGEGNVEGSGEQPLDPGGTPPAPTPPPIATTMMAVKKNDSFWKISERVFGKGERWRELAALNPGVDPKKLRAGTEVRVPADSGGNDTRNPAGNDPSDKEPKIRSHTVRKGENLSSIAQKYYRDGDWQRIFKANRDQLRNANIVPPGTVLTIPRRNDR